MSEEQLKAFWEAIQADAGLKQKLQGVTEPDAVAEIVATKMIDYPSPRHKRKPSVQPIMP